MVPTRFMNYPGRYEAAHNDQDYRNYRKYHHITDIRLMQREIPADYFLSREIGIDDTVNPGD